jgi:hypothetical protein
LCQKNIYIASLIDNTNPFKEILDTQIENKHKYIKTPNPPKYGISIKIKGNKIETTIYHPVQSNQKRVNQYIQLIKNTLMAHVINDCYININIVDIPVSGCFNFCRYINSKDTFLLPNHRFQNDDIQLLDEKNSTETYEEEKTLILSKNTPFSSKLSAIYTSSSFQPARTKYYTYAINNPFCQGALYYDPKKKPAPPALFFKNPAKHKLLSTSYVPFIKHNDYKYVLYTDGNTLSDRMRLLLCLNSVIIRKASIYEEFYTYKLKQGTNYIIYSKEEELAAIYEALENSPKLCADLIENNKVFINTILTYENILKYTADIINAICS